MGWLQAGLVSEQEIRGYLVQWLVSHGVKEEESKIDRGCGGPRRTCSEDLKGRLEGVGEVAGPGEFREHTTWGSSGVRTGRQLVFCTLDCQY